MAQIFKPLFFRVQNSQLADLDVVAAHFEAQAKKIAVLQMALDAAVYGILVTDGKGEVLFYNKALPSLLGLPDDASQLAENEWKHMVARRMKDSERILRLLMEMEDQPIIETLDIFELIDGRLLECRTRFQYLEALESGCRLWNFMDCTEQQRRERELQHLSTHDTLTGTYNRTYFDMKLRQLRLGSYYPICMVMVDIDGLKKVNDRLGHPAGDELLRHAARILRQACRTEDVVARLGGDEFGLILVRAGTETAEQVTNRVQGLLNLYNIRNPELPLSLSLGFAVANNTTEVDTLFARADSVMYDERRLRRSPKEL
jgi:diguanylate cyclase (GGDEF)-like protein